MIETPAVSVPIPVSNKPVNMFNHETKCSYNSFDPSSPPQKNDFLTKLIKRIDSFDKITLSQLQQSEVCSK